MLLLCFIIMLLNATLKSDNSLTGWFLSFFRILPLYISIKAFFNYFKLTDCRTLTIIISTIQLRDILVHSSHVNFQTSFSFTFTVAKVAVLWMDSVCQTVIPLNFAVFSCGTVLYPTLTWFPSVCKILRV